MKTKSLKYLLLLPMFMSVSCNKWLEIEPKGKIVLKTAQEYSLLFNNPEMITFPYNDFYQLNDETWINMQVISNALNTPNMNSANFTYDPTFNRSENAYGNTGSTTSFTFYQFMYRCISKVDNTILYNKDKMTGTQEEINAVVAQAKCNRALCYFLLVNTYAKPYNSATAATDGAVPLKIDPLIEIKPEPAKSTVANIYQQITNDINEAINFLPENVDSPYKFNKAAGYALKAKVHLFKKEFNECKAAALESFNLNSFAEPMPAIINKTTNKPNAGMNVYATSKENLVFISTDNGYFLLSPTYISLFNENLTAYGQASTVKDMRLYMYKQPVSGVRDYQYTMQFIPTQKEYSINSVGIRTTEVMLMLAECYAREGDYVNVKKYLEPYFTSRYENYVHSSLIVPNNITDAVKMVLNERRKELMMGYNRFFDLRRLNSEPAYQTVLSRTYPLDVVASASLLPQKTVTLPIDSPLYILPFPTRVIANDNRLVSNTW